MVKESQQYSKEKVTVKNYYDADFFDRLEYFVAQQKNNLIFDYPIIRIQLAFFLGKFKGDKYDVTKILKKISYWRLPFTLRSFATLVKLRMQLFLLCLYNRNLLKNKVLLYGFTSHYSKQEDGTELNLYLSPIKDELSNLGIEFEELLSKRNMFEVKLTRLKAFYDVLFQYHTLIFSFKAKLFNKYPAYIENAELIRCFLDENDVPEVAHCVSTYYNTKLSQEIKYNTFKQVLKVTSPRLVWSYVYYDNDTLALARAANKCKIPIVEYQHSQQSDFHFAYSKWSLMDSYSEYFPSVFWVWNQEDADRILRNFSSKKYEPKIITGGNLAVIQRKHSFNYKDASAVSGVLVSLSGEWIPNFVEKVISNDSKHTWYFRLHPRYPQDKPRLMEFKNRFPDKVEVDKANKLSLYQLFTLVKHNITNSSGTALEAEHFGIKNLIIGERGWIIYKDQISSGKFVEVGTEEMLSDILDKRSYEVDNVKEMDSVVKEREKMNKGISELFANA